MPKKVVEKKTSKDITIRHDTGRELTPELEAEFKAIAAKHEQGLITADNVVKAAESPLSPLHGFFEWDDDKAAAEYRTQQARYLIRSFAIEIEPLKIVPAFVSLGDNRTQKGGGYSWSAEVYSEADMRRRMLLTVLQDLENLIRKIEDLPEIMPVRQSILQVRTSIADSIK